MSREREAAGNTVAGLAIGGVFALFIGGVFVLLGRPGDDGDGNGLITALGAIILAGGQFALMAAIVAWAVRLGIRWSGLSDEIERAGRQRAGGPGASGLDKSYLDEDGR